MWLLIPDQKQLVWEGIRPYGRYDGLRKILYRLRPTENVPPEAKVLAVGVMVVKRPGWVAVASTPKGYKSLVNRYIFRPFPRRPGRPMGPLYVRSTLADIVLELKETWGLDRLPSERPTYLAWVQDLHPDREHVLSLVATLEADETTRMGEDVQWWNQDQVDALPEEDWVGLSLWTPGLLRLWRRQ